MSRIPATASIFSPAVSNTLRPNASPRRPRSAETVTCPKPQRNVTRAVLPADQPCARERRERQPVIRRERKDGRQGSGYAVLDGLPDRKSTHLNSSHANISYA